MTLRFTCYGVPQPQGSIRAFVIGGRTHLTSTNPKLKPWRKAIGTAAKIAMREQEVSIFGKQIPLRINVMFVQMQPKSVKRAFPSVPPDCDKLIRSLGDALTGIVYVDDGQIVEINARKVYGEVPGCHVEVAIV